MTRHYETEELLAHAWVPDGDAELALHLAACASCRERFEALRYGIERHADSGATPELPETFWKRQEIAVMRAVERRQRPLAGMGTRIAAAAAVVFVGLAFWAGRGSVSTSTVSPAVVTSTIASVAPSTASGAAENGLAASQIATDPWQSEQLEDFQTVVAWESWVSEEKTPNRGTI